MYTFIGNNVESSFNATMVEKDLHLYLHISNFLNVSILPALDHNEWPIIRDT